MPILPTTLEGLYLKKHRSMAEIAKELNVSHVIRSCNRCNKGDISWVIHLSQVQDSRSDSICFACDFDHF